MARATKTTASTKTKKAPAKSPAKAKAKSNAAKANAAKATASAKKPAARKAGTKKPSTKSMEPVIVVSHDIIAAKAYDIWLRKGQPAGLDDANWNEAEAELSAAA